MACAAAVRFLSGRTDRDLLSPSVALRAAQAFKPRSVRRPQVTIVMGCDQHRAQSTVEWLDTETGEISRRRVAPADRAGVREFLAPFGSQELEVALEATTGWRFVVEELERVGARVHLAEPAETAAMRGNKKRAKSDRADARHLRELLMAKRLPGRNPAQIRSLRPPQHGYKHRPDERNVANAINTRVRAADRIRFSLAHELGHAVMHETPSRRTRGRPSNMPIGLLAPSSCQHKTSWRSCRAAAFNSRIC